MFLAPAPDCSRPANATISAVGFAATSLVCGFVFFRFLLPDMSYNIRPH